MSAEPDELFTLRTLFWLGSYQAAINEANALTKVNPSLRSEKDEYLYRSYLGLGQYDIIISEIKDNPNTSVGLMAIKVLARYIEDISTKDIALLQLNEWLSEPTASNNKTLKTVIATLHMYDNNWKDSIKAISSPSCLEHHALLIQLYLHIDRHDLASKELKTLKAIDEDSVLTMLATAWVHIATGVSTKIQEAGYIYDELIDKYGASPAILNGLAVAKMHQGQWEEAEASLKEAITKAPSDPDSLANIITVSYHLQRPQDVINRYTNQLKTKAPNHTLVQALNTFEGAFDRVSASLA